MRTMLLSGPTAERIVDGDLDLYDILNESAVGLEIGEQAFIQELYEETAREHGLHQDDDFEEIMKIMVDNIAEDYNIR